MDPSREPYEMERREAALVLTFTNFLRKQGLTVERFRVQPADEAKPIFTDLYIRERNMLVEAKGTTARNSFRMAIGQLADYRRFLTKPLCGILLPAEPRPDLKRLAAAERVYLFWPEAGGFRQLEPTLGAQS